MKTSSNPYLGAITSSSWLDVGGDSVVTVYFANDYGHAWSDQEKAVFQAVFDAYEAVADIKFSVVDNHGDADLVENLVTSKQMNSIMGIRWDGWQDEPSLNGSRGFFDYTLDYWSENFAIGSRAHYLVLHEIGHGLGLEHPHSNWHGSGLFPGVTLNRPKDLGDFNLNVIATTVMTYNYNNTPSYDFGQTAGPMAFDIAALQLLYGSRDFATGDNTYELPDQNGTGTFWTCIWDTGGTDEIAYSGDRDVVIDLRAATLQREPGGGGFFSSANGIYGGISIANGVEIENARGGGGDDTLVANRLENVLNGGKGQDFASYLFDTEDLTLDLRLSGPQVSKGAANGDQLVSIENLYGGSGNDVLIGNSERNILSGITGDDNLYGEEGSDLLLGGHGNDILYGGSGNDVLQGHRGRDQLFGGDGDDTLVGGNGAYRDYLTGGNGSDVFDFNRKTDSMQKSNYRDVITDFEKGDDIIDLRTIDANTKKGGNQKFKFIGTDKFSGDPGELRYLKKNKPGTDSDNTFVYADINGDKKADFVLELDGLITLSQWDFFL